MNMFKQQALAHIESESHRSSELSDVTQRVQYQYFGIKDSITFLVFLNLVDCFIYWCHVYIKSINILVYFTSANLLFSKAPNLSMSSVPASILFLH